MLSLQCPKIMIMYASQRAAQLGATATGVPPGDMRNHLRRWLGEPLVRLAAWVRPVPAPGHAVEAP